MRVEKDAEQTRKNKPADPIQKAIIDAWDKAKEMGHVVFNFGGAGEADRLGEICAAPVDGAKLLALLKIGESISIESK